MANNKRDLVLSEIYQPHLNGGRKNNPSTNNQVMIENMYIRVISELCMNRFKWVGLPDTIDTRYLELQLFKTALVVFFKDTDDIDAQGNRRHTGTGRFLALNASGAGPVNMYDNPTHFQVTAPTFNRKLTGSECVPIYANYLRVPDWDIVMTYARKLADIDRTIEITVENMRQTKILVTDENTRHSWIQVLNQVKTGKPWVLGAPGLDPTALAAIDLNIHHEYLPNLLLARSKMWADCMTLLGVNNNASQDKKERLVSGEVEANDEQISATRNIALNARRMAAAQINRMFDLTVSVDFNRESETLSYAIGEF